MPALKEELEHDDCFARTLFHEEDSVVGPFESVLTSRYRNIENLYSKTKKKRRQNEGLVEVVLDVLLDLVSGLLV